MTEQSNERNTSIGWRNGFSGLIRNRSYAEIISIAFLLVLAPTVFLFDSGIFGEALQSLVQQDLSNPNENATYVISSEAFKFTLLLMIISTVTGLTFLAGKQQRREMENSKALDDIGEKLFRIDQCIPKGSIQRFTATDDWKAYRDFILSQLSAEDPNRKTDIYVAVKPNGYLDHSFVKRIASILKSHPNVSVRYVIFDNMDMDPLVNRSVIADRCKILAEELAIEASELPNRRIAFRAVEETSPVEIVAIYDHVFVSLQKHGDDSEPMFIHHNDSEIADAFLSFCNQKFMFEGYDLNAEGRINHSNRDLA